jgi:hypothetical protein
MSLLIWLVGSVVLYLIGSSAGAYSGDLLLAGLIGLMSATVFGGLLGYLLAEHGRLSIIPYAKGGKSALQRDIRGSVICFEATAYYSEASRDSQMP